MSFSSPLQYLSCGLSFPFLEGWGWTESGKSFLGGLMGRPLPTLRPVPAIIGWSRTGPPGLLTSPIPGGVSKLMLPIEETVCMDVSWIWPPCPPFPKPTMCGVPDMPTVVKPIVEGVVVSALRFTPFFYRKKKLEIVVITLLWLCYTVYNPHNWNTKSLKKDSLLSHLVLLKKNLSVSTSILHAKI